MKTPDYMLKEDFIYIHGNSSTTTVEKGSLVSIVEWRWLPKHIKEYAYDQTQRVYCQTKYGLICMPRDLLVEL